MSINEQFFRLIEKSKNILISFPLDWNGDAIAASLALFLFLKKLGKKVEIGAEQMKNTDNFKIPTESFNFLPSFSEIKNSLENLMKFIVSVDISRAKVSQIKYVIDNDRLNFIISPRDGFFTEKDISSQMSGFKYDLIITVDSQDLESLGRIYDNNIDFFYKTPIINIDQSPENEEFGQLNLLDLKAVAVSEIVFDLLSGRDLKLIDADIATCLLTGIIFRTKSFKTPNITPRVLLATSKLIELGARREEIVAHLYRSRSLNTLKLWGRVLNNLSTSDDHSIIWASLFKNDFQISESSEENLQDIIDELIISIPSAKLIVIFYSLSEISFSDSDDQTVVVHQGGDHIFQTKITLCSVKNLDALELLKKFNPTGTKKIAQASVNRPLPEVEKEIIGQLRNNLEKIF